MKPQTEARAKLIAGSLDRSSMQGLDLGGVISVVTTLLPIIIDCFDPDDGPQAQEYVKKRYSEPTTSDDRYRGYDKRLSKATARRVKQAGRKTRQRVTWTQAYEIGFAVLDDIRSGDPQQASVAISENHNFLLI